MLDAFLWRWEKVFLNGGLWIRAGIGNTKGGKTAGVRGRVLGRNLLELFETGAIRIEGGTEARGERPGMRAKTPQKRSCF